MLTTGAIPPAVTGLMVALVYALAAHDARPLGERPGSLREQIDEAVEIVGLIQQAEEEAMFDFTAF